MTQTFTLTIQMGNAAMQCADDIAAVLAETADRISRDGTHAGRIRDYNGNTVGTYGVTGSVDYAGTPDCTVDCAEYGCAGPGGWTHAR